MPPPVKPVGDAFAPFFTVKFLTYQEAARIVNEDGFDEREAATAINAAEVASGGADTSGTTLTFNYGDRMRSYAASLEVVHKGDAHVIATVSFSPPYEDAIAIVDDQVIQRDSIMVLEWGWLASEGGSVITSSVGVDDEGVGRNGRHLFVIQQPSLAMTDTDFNITIVGIDLFGYAATTREDRRCWPRTRYTNDWQILEEVIRKNNMTPDTSQVPSPQIVFTPTGPRAVPGTGSALFAPRPRDEDDPEVVEQNEKDWVFFKKVCNSNNCSYYTIGNKVYIVDNDLARTKRPSYNLLFFRQPKTDADIVMLSFSTNALETLFHPAASNELTWNYTDLDTGAVRQTRIDPATDPNFQSLGERTASGKQQWTGRVLDIDGSALIARPSFGPTETGEVLSVPGFLANRNEHATQVARGAHTWANTDAEATIPGTPGIVPMMVVLVACGSRLFSGSYLVIEVTHSLSMSGYETKLKLKREASTGDRETGTGVEPTNPNEHEADENPQGEEPQVHNEDGGIDGIIDEAARA
ncbi:MAG TPA: hypothetical protein VFH61_00475 [Thermoleophilia bacterium]|nr:hypothetical protein [Thermoleophilia bacterium]